MAEADPREPMDELFVGAFEPEVAARPGDEAKLGAMVEAALAAPAVEASPDSTPTSGASASKLGWGVAVTGVVVAVVVALAWPRGPSPAEEPAPLPTVVEADPPPEETAVPAEEAPMAVELEPAPRPPAPNPEPEEEAAPAEPATEATEAEASPTQRSKPAPALPSAADLLRDANEARRKGEFRAADRLFRQLARKYPGSREERLARVTHGMLLLDKLGRADEALARFERYLDDQPRGTLAEEALVGRAKAARELGRSEVELEAWQRLLERFPRSAHAPKAQARIDVLTE